MSDEPDGQELIETFFTALSLRDLGRCEAVAARLQALSREQPTWKPWCLYLAGILANERDHDYAEAERIFNHLSLADLDLPLRGRVLIALGRTCHYQGHWADAIDAYERSLPVFAELNQPLDQVKAWKEIAISCRKGFTQGDFGPEVLQRAVACCRRALDVLQATPSPSPNALWLEGSLWNTLGLVYRSLGRWDEAIACYRRDLDICRSLDDRHGIGLSYGNLGEVYQKRGRDTWPQALEAYRTALHIIREFDDRYEETEALANLGFMHQEMGEHERALAHYNQALAVIEDLRAGISSEAARAGFFATIADTYANAVLLCLETGDCRQAFDIVERARSRAFLDALAVRSSDGSTELEVLARKVETATMTLAEVQAAMPADALLLEYFTTGLVEAQGGRFPPGQDPERHRFPPAKTLVFAVTRDDVEVRDVGLSPNDLRPRQLDSVVERHFLQPEIRHALYDRLIGPVAHLLEGKQRLYVVPHGPLHYVPFQALMAPDNDTLLREEGPPLVYAPSATILFNRKAPEIFRLAQNAERAQAPCLALGYNGAGATELRFAEEEARSVARLTGGCTLAGPSPKKEALFGRATDYRLLHFSCHGEFDPEEPMSSALHLAAGETLTALEVLDRLQLRCDLIVLSACESGLSRVRRGDELVGFLRAFLYAGAPTLISTLWRVDERSTLILMERFYRQILAGTGFAEALRQAQLYLRSQPSFTDPYYWAPFILVGKHRA
jgi:tetratricopeptide (TPR) repeat protein